MTGSQVARGALAGARPATLVDAAGLTSFAPETGEAPRHFDISYSLEDRYLQLRQIGVWDEAMFEDFAAAYLAVVARLNAAGGITHLMVDAARFGTQSPEVADRFPGLIRASDPLPEQRTACVIPAMVNRVQARQGGDLVNARYFRTLGDAADWLFGNEA